MLIFQVKLQICHLLYRPQFSFITKHKTDKHQELLIQIYFKQFLGIATLAYYSYYHDNIVQRLNRAHPYSNI